MKRLLGCEDDAHAFVRVAGQKAWACRRCGVQDAFFAAAETVVETATPAAQP